MNPLLDRLQPYPFEKLEQLKKGISPPATLSPILLSIGEPKHPTPSFIGETLACSLSGLGHYPTTQGLPEFRSAIVQWLQRRFYLPDGILDPHQHVLPCAGTREALFSFAQAVLDPCGSPLVLMPNPFYQIYEGAALLAGAEPYFINASHATGYLPDFDSVPDTVWARCALLYLCSPANPSGAVLTTETHKQLIELSQKFCFVIASDECYSELYREETAPPVGLLQTAYAMGNTEWERCIVFHSLSKRSNAPGLRSGFVAGDATLLAKFLRYRTYHGCALSWPIQQASMAAWQDEKHVIENRAVYRRKFTEVQQILGKVWKVELPPAGFYLWLETPAGDPLFARDLFARTHVTVLPGSFLSRRAHGMDPGENHIRLALVPPLEECLEAAHRIQHFVSSF